MVGRTPGPQPAPQPAFLDRVKFLRLKRQGRPEADCGPRGPPPPGFSFSVAPTRYCQRYGGVSGSHASFDRCYHGLTLTRETMSSSALGSPAAGPCQTLPPKVMI